MMDPELSEELRRRRDQLPDEDELVFVTEEAPVHLIRHSYPLGIFPWPYEEDAPTPWVWPEERGILAFDHFHLGKSSRRAIRRGEFEVRFNTAFEEVIQACATVENRETWIFPFMQKAYQEAHQLGFAQSVEVFQRGELVGGLYGIMSPGFFSGESMFHCADAAGKAAIDAMVARLQKMGHQWMDIQQLTPHMEAMGATSVSRSTFAEMIDQAAEKASA